METEPQIENTDVQIKEEHKIWHKKNLEYYAGKCHQLRFVQLMCFV